jgi:ribonuclease E
MTEFSSGGGDDRGLNGPIGANPAPIPSTPLEPTRAPSDRSAESNDGDDGGEGGATGQARRRRGSRGGRGRGGGPKSAAGSDDGGGDQPDLPDPPGEGRVRSTSSESPESPESSDAAPSRPKIGDSRPAPAQPGVLAPKPQAEVVVEGGGANKKRRRGGRGRSKGGQNDATHTVGVGRSPNQNNGGGQNGGGQNGGGQNGRNKGGARRPQPIEAILASSPAVDLDEETLAARRGRERKGRAVGRYLMAVHVTPSRTQIAVVEGRNLIEHYVSRPADDTSEIHGNIYLGKVQNVLPGMEAAFVDISTPKNAVLYAGDVSADMEDSDAGNNRGPKPRIETMLRARQMIVCQVTKNPIGVKGARLTQEVSLPGRFVVLIPNSKTYGISKRLPDHERKRLRAILDHVKPAQHGVIVRTAAENVVEEELRADVQRLLSQWEAIDALAKRSQSPALLYREPDMAVRVIREEFNIDYRNIVIDDRQLYEEVREYVGAISPALVDRVEYYDPAVEGLPLFEEHHIHEQLHKALDRKVWLPSGGSLIIEHTEALTVIDVNTGKNVGSTSLEDTVLKNNLEAATEIAHQLRLRDIGGIIVIDFIDMEIKANREKVVQSFRASLARDKTRTQVFDISDLGLIEMTRKRIGEGLITSYADACPMCSGRGLLVDESILS